MSLVKGPFTLKWGSNVLNDVEEVDLSLETETNEITTVQGNKIIIKTGLSASATLTLLSTDIASLATVLPQYYVAKDANMKDGTQVKADEGAIDLAAASCESTTTKNNLDIKGCGANAPTIRLKDCSTEVDSADLGDGLLKVSITFTGEPESGKSVMQILGTKDAA